MKVKTISWLIVSALCLLSRPIQAAIPSSSDIRLPGSVPPSLGCWFWSEAEFAPEAYRPFLDLVAQHADYNLLTTSLRVAKREVTDEAVHRQIQAAADYARQRDLRLVMDLDVRLARARFQSLYPDELQEMLRLREVELSGTDEVALTIQADVPSDHYTFAATPYVPLAARLVRVYSYARVGGKIVADSLKDITTQRCRARDIATNQLTVVISGDVESRGRHACVMAAFTHFTPDVFAPHLVEFQRAILKQYGDVALGGACKDEWGFPPCFDGCPAKNDFWYSRFYSEAYAQRTGGRDLIRDCLLMWTPEEGLERERLAAINHYQALAWQRNAALETDFYHATKAVFGSNALVATHPTWWPNPDVREFKKNGLDWWAAKRDYAQTDEVTPFAVRTALAKKWGSPWYNMFYSSKKEDYEFSLWSHALAGGRVNYHPLYPSDQGLKLEIYRALLRGGLMRGQARVRLLNFISRSPLDCPVAVIFGHAGAMNWAGPAYNDVGLRLTDALWRQGYPADLIPADEIGSGALQIEPSTHGWIRYGVQRYAAAVLFHPEFEPATTATFFRQAGPGQTDLWRVGDWTRNFEAESFIPELPARMVSVSDAEACAAQVVKRLRELGIPAQTPATAMLGWDNMSAAPPRRGVCRLVDGTVLVLAGAEDVAGDLIETNFVVNGYSVEAKAKGVVGVRLRKDGTLAALAAGGLRFFRAGSVTLDLDQPVDMAVWQDATGRMEGVLQDWTGPVPASLTRLTDRWRRLAVPAPSADAH